MDLGGAILSLIVGLIVSYASARFYVGQTKADLIKEYANRLNERKWETYAKFGQLVDDLLRATESDNFDSDESKTTLRNKLHTISSELLLVGSDAVIRAYTLFEAHPGLDNLMEIILCMRTDLGYESKGVSKTSLKRLYVKAIPDASANTQENIHEQLDRRAGRR